MSATVSVTGIKEIDAVLKGLPDQLTHRILQAAHADASKPLLSKAKSIVPVRTGKLRNSININKPSISRVSQIGLIEVGPIDVKYDKFVEFGHDLVTKAGVKIGFVRERPYLGPAFEETKGIVQQNIAEAIGKNLLNFMNRTIK